MGRIRGNLRSLLVLFFMIAVFLAGVLPWAWDAVRASGALVDVATFGSLTIAFFLVLLILARILWVNAARVSRF